MPKTALQITVEDLWQFARIGSVALSPDGRRAVCAVTQPSLADNRSATQLWLLCTAGQAPPRALTTTGTRNGQPAWSPRGDRIAFIAKRDQEDRKDETPQLYLISPDGGEATRAAHFAPGVEAFRWLPDGSGIVFAAWAWPDAKSAKAQARRFRACSERKETGLVTGEANYRHWDHAHPVGRVVRLFHLRLRDGRITDLFAGSRHELGRDELVPEAFDVSPDGRRVAYAFDPAPEQKAGNRRAIAEIEIASRRVRLLRSDPDWDLDLPRYRPDGAQLAVLAAQIGVKHTMPAKPALLTPSAGSGSSTFRPLGADWDHEAGSAPRWAADGRMLRVSAESRGRCLLWRCDPQRDHFEVDGENAGWLQSFDVAGSGADEVVVTVADSHSHPARVHARRGGQIRLRIESFNDRLLSQLALGEVREVSVRGALGQAVQMWLTFPRGFDPRRRHALLQVVHGGPYTAAGESFSYRWNAHLLASQGHVVAQVNYHGSSGFGYAFKDSIIGRLGELEYQDIEAGTDWLLRQPWADRERVYASGASYGGFMVAWMNGRTPPGRYRAYVCHAGVFDRIATFAADSYPQRPKDMAADFWADMPRVLAQSPHSRAAQMQTPTLVIHGAQDYRVPDCNGLAYYNTLKARGVDARLLWFPDENHWVLKPQNSRQWHAEFFAWLERHRGSAGPVRKRRR